MLRLYEKNWPGRRAGDFEETMVYDAEAAPLPRRSLRGGAPHGAADDTNFEYGLNCIPDNIDRQIADGKKGARSRKG